MGDTELNIDEMITRLLEGNGLCFHLKIIENHIFNRIKT